jgi:competence protein ComEA
VRARLRALVEGDVAEPPSASPGDDPTAASGQAAAPDAEVVARALVAERRRRTATMALALLLAAGAGWFVLQVLRGPDPAPLELVPGDPPPTSGAREPSSGPGGSGVPTSGAAPAPSAPALLVVHVIGEVRRPGLVRVPDGSRVADAIEAAGGLTRAGGSGALNLARPVVDGEQVVVTEDAGPDPPVGSSPGGTIVGGTGSAGPLDLNSATEADLDALPGVGPVLAGRILAWREANGAFTAVDQLAEVPGIGERTLERLAPLVRV